MTIKESRKNNSNTMTVAQPSACSHCNHGHVANSWLKPEIVLLCALGTFGISAVIWAISTPHDKQPVAKQVKQVAPASEIDRLFAQAGKMPVERLTPPPRTISEVRVVAPAKAVADTPKPERHTVSKPVVAEPLAAEPVQTESKVEPKPEPKTQAKAEESPVDEVAEYNRALAAFFETRKSAAPDTVDGAVQNTPVEPPTYDEWMKSGKASF